MPALLTAPLVVKLNGAALQALSDYSQARNAFVDGEHESDTDKLAERAFAYEQTKATLGWILADEVSAELGV